jgi:hypothetical protein
MAEKEVRKTTVKKTVRRTTTKVAPRKTVAKKASAVSSSTVRRAPSRLSEPGPKKRSKRPFFIFVILLVVVGASVGIGYSDKGAIDVSSLIAARKQNATPEEQERFKTVPVQQGQTGTVNGGLVGTGKTPDPLQGDGTASAEATTSTSSQSSTQATSTDAVTPEEVPAEENTEQPASEPEAADGTPLAQ